MPVADTLREDLREIGERRARIRAETAKLVSDTASGVKRARGVLRVSEVARLVDLDRTCIYRTYG